MIITNNQCLCGCGQEIIQKFKYHISKYIRGHNTKGKKLSDEHKKKVSNALKGRPLSKEHKKKLSESYKTREGKGVLRGEKHPMFGKHHSEETKLKLSKSHIGIHIHSPESIKKILKSRSWYKHSERTKENISKAKKGKVIMSEEAKRKNSEAHKGKTTWNKGIPCREETKRKISEANKGKVGYNLGKRHSEESKQKIRAKRLLQVMPMKDTKPELKLQQFLIDNNISFIKHKPIYGQPDIFIEPNICIFADGCYWHSCQNCGFKNDSERIKKDIKVRERLQTDGYSVLRFWEHEINANVINCGRRIQEEILNNFTNQILVKELGHNILAE